MLTLSKSYAVKTNTAPFCQPAKIRKKKELGFCNWDLGFYICRPKFPMPDPCTLAEDVLLPFIMLLYLIPNS
jgi:hypothetical protein